MDTSAPQGLSQSATIRRPIRTGPAETLGVPTDELLLDALQRGRVDDSLELLDYLVAEAGRIHELFSTWLASLQTYSQNALPDWPKHDEDLESRIGAPVPLIDHRTVATDEQQAVRAAILARDVDGARTALTTLRSAQMAVHDTQTDWAWGMLTVLQRALGEASMEDVFRVTQREWLTARYDQVRDMSPRELFELTIEGMRGHYCGSGRSGEINVVEDDEKWTMSFDPCGTGGRMRRGDPARGQVPRTEPPFEFAAVEGAYDWTWGREGVCLYCAHCAVVNEILPIEQLGTPMRVTEYPQDAGQPCRWIVYKSPELVPDSVFERVGKRRPSPDGESRPA